MKRQGIGYWVLGIGLGVLISGFLGQSCYAKEINILYTGQTHAMLYTCSCPVEKDGGVARRAALVKKLRKDNPNTLLLDSGAFFAGGLLDEYTQNTQLDMQRTALNLKAMELMKYDALAVGSDELNFGSDFFQANVKKSNLPFLSVNLASEKVMPYIIKDVSGVKIGILGLTDPRIKQKVAGINLIDLKAAVQNAVTQLKENKVNIIIGLSNLDERENQSLIDAVSGIDILITNQRTKDEAFIKAGSTLILYPAWQGRKLGVLTLDVDADNNIKDYKVDLLRLSDKINDDPEVKTILPRCFSDMGCKDKNGMTGTCLNPGSIKASCKFEQQEKVKLTVIVPRKCVVCNTEMVTDYLKQFFPGLVVTRLTYPDAQSDKMIKNLKITSLPAYLLENKVRQDKNFSEIEQSVEQRGEFYMLKPQVSGMGYLLGRKKNEGQIDLFISLYGEGAAPTLEVMREFNPKLHFLAMERGNKFDAIKGNVEAEEYLRSVCVGKYYPEKLWDYIICRARNINSAWWDSCLASGDAYYKIKACATSHEGEALLKDNISLNKELEIMFGPTYLLNNQEIFSSQGVPKKENLKNIFKTK